MGECPSRPRRFLASARTVPASPVFVLIEHVYRSNVTVKSASPRPAPHEMTTSPARVKDSVVQGRKLGRRLAWLALLALLLVVAVVA